MRIIIVGATGVLGKSVHKALSQDHEVLKVGLTQGDYQADITDTDSVERLFKQVGEFDALIATTGAVHFGPLTDISPEQWQLGLSNKLIGQVNLVTEGMKHIRDEGSFTLTSGIIAQDPIRFGVAATMVNRAVEGFVSAAALEMPRGIRINAVSPTILSESVEHYGPFFKGFDPVPADKAALGFVRSVEGHHTGRVFEVKGVI